MQSTDLTLFVAFRKSLLPSVLAQVSSRKPFYRAFRRKAHFPRGKARMSRVVPLLRAKTVTCAPSLEALQDGLKCAPIMHVYDFHQHTAGPVDAVIALDRRPSMSLFS